MDIIELGKIEFRGTPSQRARLHYEYACRLDLFFNYEDDLERKAEILESIAFHHKKMREIFAPYHC